MKPFLIGLLIATFALAEVQAATFYVSPSGNDKNSGSKSKPFATLQRAQQAVREFKQKGKRDEPVTVLLRKGTYDLAEPVVFEPADSGSSKSPVTYAAAPGEQPVLSGGRRITGWRKHNEKLWVADLPEVNSGAWRFNQLYVNGELRPRARTPNKGFYIVAGCPEGTPKTVNYHKDCQSFEFKPGDIRADWTNLQDVEVIVYHFWTDSHLPIKSVDATSNLVTFVHKAGKVFTDDFTENGARYVVENVFEALDEPGEWYLNRRTGSLYYMPKPGEEMDKVEFIAPRLPAFLHLRGKATQR
ncbi:MAG TPA: hypothetical protein VEC99_12945, partial [Clostridia bacterium]|nr:hypothetical protein [Clostridia bacterium]